MNHFRKYRIWTVKDPEVLEIIKEAVKFANHFYFRVNAAGEQELFAVNRLLKEKLPCTAVTASQLLTSAFNAGLIPWGVYCPRYKRPKEPRPKKPKPKVVKPKRVIIPEPEPEPEPNKPRHFLIETSNGWFGVWHEDSCSQTIVSRSESLARKELARIIKSERKVKLPYRKSEVDKLIERVDAG